MNRPLSMAMIAGEESGDLLGADIAAALRTLSGGDVTLIGVGGRHLQAQGLNSLFPGSEIALMGISAVMRDLPRLLRRIGETARAVVAARPDCLVTVDSPDFTLRVARKVRTLDPTIPIIHCVCPSVWAWRPGRAPAMKAYVDQILCILPFEPVALARLGGPLGTFIGHRLTSHPGVLTAAVRQREPRDLSPERMKTLLLLPGSRRSEVRSLLEPFRETVDILRERGNRLRLVLPTVPHVADLVRESVRDWPQLPEITTGADDKWRAFGKADAALIASGTVSLELALSGVPLVSTYRLDPLARLASRLVTTWSALLPNLIVDRAVAPEFYDRFVRPQMLARVLESLLADTPARVWQISGFAEVAARMATDRPSGDIAAAEVMRAVANRR